MKNKFLVMMSLIIFSAIAAAAQTGGTFTIEKSVIAAGGGTAAGGTFKVEGTTGQSATNILQNQAFTIYGGFFTPITFAPTAASASVSGRVRTPTDSGLVNAIVSLTDTSGNTRTVRTSSFGYFRFDEIETGQTYILSVQSKRYTFAPQVVTVLENLTELNFVGW